MIEIIYNESGKTGSSVLVKPPKNIRQIGSPRGRHKIYVEDYVYTFLHSAAFEGISQKRAAILLGQSEMSQDIRYTFISGAISCDEFVFQEDGIKFDENCWEYIYKEIKQYFDHQEIVGWFLGLTGFPLELTPMVEAAHRKYFAGRDKVLFLSEPAEGEDIFFTYEQGILQKKEGYYIYYEKNLSMQEYMVCNRENVRKRQEGIAINSPDSESISEDFAAAESLEQVDSLEQGEEKTAAEQKIQNSAAEQAIQNYRSMLLEKKDSPTPRKMSMLLYTAASAAMIVLCVIGITTMDNYEKMKQVEETLAVISQNPTEADSQEEAQPVEVVVESVPGEVTPEKSTEQSDDAETAAQPAEQSDDTKPGSQSAEQSDATKTDNQSAEQSDDAKPDDAETVAQPQEADAAALAQTYLEQGYYEVQAGDKLELICMKIYQTTAIMDKLCEVNQIEDVDKIYAGQKLILP